jgi:hypothetical protein
MHARKMIAALVFCATASLAGLIGGAIPASAQPKDDDPHGPCSQLYYDLSQDIGYMHDAQQNLAHASSDSAQTYWEAQVAHWQNRIETDEQAILNVGC